MKINYNEVMKEIIDNLDSNNHRLLLHSCCGPCSTAVIKRLMPYFDITVLYYNPNIEPYEEYLKRKNEQIRFIKALGSDKVHFLDCDYDNEDFLKVAKGLETEKEGGLRCHECYRLRLNKTAKVAKENDFDYFCTTLTVSPYKNSQVLNEIAKEISDKENVKYLYSDFKKEEGYKISIEEAKKYNLYRQNYCGCHYSHEIDLSE